jgi:hypothetical protein
MMFLVWMWAGNWGAPQRPINPDASPVSQYIFAPYTFVYTGAGGCHGVVFGIYRYSKV